MLEAATRLESFDSYKLWVGHAPLHFASNHLKTIRLHRSDTLSAVSACACMRDLSILHSVVDHHACLFRRLCRLFRFNRHQFSVWSPVLQSLDLQACYSLEKIRLLDKHALAAVLPDDFRPSRNIRINLLNACVDRSLLEELSSNPRIGQVSGVDKLDGMW